MLNRYTKKILCMCWLSKSISLFIVFLAPFDGNKSRSIAFLNNFTWLKKRTLSFLKAFNISLNIRFLICWWRTASAINIYQSEYIQLWIELCIPYSVSKSAEIIVSVTYFNSSFRHSYWIGGEQFHKLEVLFEKLSWRQGACSCLGAAP